MIQQTLVLIKPDGISKELTGNILTKLAETKLEMVACKMVKVAERLAQEHYKQLSDKPFFGELIGYIQGKLHSKNKVIAMVYCGEDAIGKIRQICGATNPEEADPVSVRGSYGRVTTKGVFENVLHASSDAEEAEREIKLWFEPTEIIVDCYPTKVINEMLERVTWEIPSI